jgi:hypothetical protein
MARQMLALALVLEGRPRMGDTTDSPKAGRLSIQEGKAVNATHPYRWAGTTGHRGRFKPGTGLLTLIGDGRQSYSSPESAPAGRPSGECRSDRLIVGRSCFELGRAMFARTSKVCGWRVGTRFLRRSNLYYTALNAYAEAPTALQCLDTGAR